MSDLLASLTTEQHTLLSLLHRTFREHRVWPTWQFVELQMDLQGTDASAIESSLPTIGRRHGVYGLSYGLVWARGGLGVAHQPEDTIGLTMAGLFRVGAPDYVEALLATIAVGCEKLRTFNPSPARAETLEITSDDVFSELNRRSLQPDISGAELYEMLEHEPPMWTGGRGLSPDGRARWQITREFRRYCGCEDFPTYLDAVRGAADESARQLSRILPAFGPRADPGASAPEDDEPASESTASSAAVHIRAGQMLTPHVPLLGDGIDPELWEFVRPLVEANRWEQVAREAAAFVETRARDWTGSDADALDLMSSILKPRREECTERRSYNEADGWHQMARGFIQAVRNHVAHNSVGLEGQFRYGLGALGTASLLVDRIRSVVKEDQADL